VNVTELRLRGILDSRAQVTVEAELTLEGRHTGLGSSPRAIAPGRRERRRGPNAKLGAIAGSVVRSQLVGRRVDGQRAVDALLDELLEASEAGAGVTLAVSLAFARAAATAARRPLYAYLSELAGTTPKLPRLMVNVLSGGIHADQRSRSFQQVMVLPAAGTLTHDIRLACDVFAEAERLAGERPGGAVLSASSGLVVAASSEEQLRLLEAAVAAAGCAAVCSLGVDVAAEHLRSGRGRYRLGEQELDATQLATRLAELALRYRLSYLEDPFHPGDAGAWRRLRAALPRWTTLVGDDLFATDASRIDHRLADGILLKPSQAGTVTATLDAALAARRVGMLLAVSHRSGETEDTAICDLAVALGAELIKVGGPRRGDRLAKYNQLLRLAELIAAGPANPTRHFAREAP
jgi:enolase 1/2/3